MLRPTQLPQAIIGALLLFGSPSCGSWSGNPPSSKVETGTTAPVEKKGTVEIILQGSGTSLRVLNNSLTVTDKSGKEAGQIILTSVQIQLSSITVRRNAGDSTQSAVLSGPFTLDLLTNAITPALSKLTLPEGDYRDLRMNLYRPEGGSSIVLNGTYIAPNQASSYVKIALDAQDEIAFMKETEADIITVSSGGNTQIALHFQLNNWFNFNGKQTDLSGFVGKDITLDQATASTLQDLRQSFLSNVKEATDFDKYAGPGDDKSKETDNGDDDKDRDRGRR